MVTSEVLGSPCTASWDHPYGVARHSEAHPPVVVGAPLSEWGCKWWRPAAWEEGTKKSPALTGNAWDGLRCDAPPCPALLQWWHPSASSPESSAQHVDVRPEIPTGVRWSKLEAARKSKCSEPRCPPKLSTQWSAVQ